VLEEFIEGNNLRARLVQGRGTGSRIRCRVFVAGKEEVLLITLKSSTIDFGKVEKAFGKRVEPVPEERVEEMTGYRKKFLPPVSIYGVKVLLDEMVAGKELVVCALSKEKSLEIPVSEIKDFNDDLTVVDIIKKGGLD